MKLKVGDRVRVNNPGSMFHNNTGTVSEAQKNCVILDKRGGSIFVFLNDHLELISPTIEELVKELGKAGFKHDPNSGTYWKEIKLVQVVVSLDGENSFVKVGFASHWKMNEASAVKLAKTLVETCK